MYFSFLISRVGNGWTLMSRKAFFHVLTWVLFDRWNWHQSNSTSSINYEVSLWPSIFGSWSYIWFSYIWLTASFMQYSVVPLSSIMAHAGMLCMHKFLFILWKLDVQYLVLLWLVILICLLKMVCSFGHNCDKKQFWILQHC